VTAARRVLVVEDDPDIRTLIAAILEDDGFAVDLARHGREALAQAARQCPDVVILDLMMPVMTGWAFIAVWQADSTTRGIPIVVTSAEVPVPTAHALGVHAFVPKPFDVELLLAIVHAVFGQGGTIGPRGETPLDRAGRTPPRGEG
jgi:CheY-like chemotaxis protein